MPGYERRCVVVNRDYKQKKLLKDDINMHNTARHFKLENEEHESKVKERFYRKPYSREKHASL